MDAKEILTKWFNTLLDNPDLIALAGQAERGEFGEQSSTVLFYLDRAINSLASARHAMVHAQRAADGISPASLSAHSNVF